MYIILFFLMYWKININIKSKWNKNEKYILFLISGSWLPVIYFNFRKSIFLFSKVDIFTSGSWLSVIYFDFQKSTSVIYFDFRKSQLLVIYFDFRKSTSGYILTSEIRLCILSSESWHPEIILGVWSTWLRSNGQRVFLEFLNFWRCRKNTWRCGKKTPIVW